MMNAHKDFIGERKSYICDWRGKEDGAGAQAFYNQHAGGSSAAKPTPAAAPEEKKAAAPAKAAPKAAAPKQPSKVKRGNKWVVEYMQDTSVEFAQDDLGKSTTIEFFSCNNI